MRLPVWYVLASDGARLHRDMVIISARVLRHVDPACVVNLTCDRQSSDAAAASGVSLSSIFDRVEVREEPSISPMHRSRALKLRLRLELQGDFLYVDSDTLAVSSLDRFPSFTSSVMLAYDYLPGQRVHRGAPLGAAARFAQIGWPFPVPKFFNGGVSAWRDDAVAHRFAERWFENWRTSVAAGVPYDQPALAHSDRELGGVIGVLPPMCNAQVNAWPGFARQAVLWHFWHSQTQSADGPLSVLDQLIATFEKSGDVDFDLMDAARRSAFPWVRSLGLRPYLETGNYAAALREVPRTFERFLRRKLGAADQG